ncbi:C2H2 finger domain protein [Aspergillus ibericus CBS 121593]|uniref:C2H2 finger domain protein n=1 Tax=Aspergillus ibericus CBS 121593 TaxID=1448316 RepID=A0A395GP64_9EURO|nr:C2H2 finger domain protein [Aspergillus ibericus CBS 121593]RAK96748.1 C2H2 finger domain protein [Aspergillus ibericus CBS 121593]
MDLASLISHPGPEPLSTYKARASYSPPMSSYKRSIEQVSDSYFSSVPISYTRTPQPPLSPPVEEHSPKCSLPSISTLLEGADGASVHAAKRTRMTPPLQRESSQAYDFKTNGPQLALPPTPPLRPGSGFHSASHSPASSISAASEGNAPKRSDSFSQVPVALPSPSDRSSISSQGSVQGAPYASPAPSVASYSSPIEPSASSAMFYQRTASTTTAAPLPTPAPQQIISPVNPAWQHHHYFPPSSTTPFQQNHDRYICRTCHKAFSRPSSLRIHSHSHTGEKPFRCTHAGCGKAFSVRSNMKRHERGCHSGRPVATAMV